MSKAPAHISQAFATTPAEHSLDILESGADKVADVVQKEYKLPSVLNQHIRVGFEGRIQKVLVDEVRAIVGKDLSQKDKDKLGTAQLKIAFACQELELSLTMGFRDLFQPHSSQSIQPFRTTVGPAAKMFSQAVDALTDLLDDRLI